MIAVEELTKHYGRQPALDRLTFSVPAGEIFGFVGPNGAGKTTTLRILAALLEPTSGRALIDGADVTRDPRHVHRRLGYMPDFFGLYDQLTVAEYLDFYADCYQQPRAKRKVVVDNLLELVALGDRRDQQVDTLSRGLKQRVCLARALVHDPAVLLLDEPASGLDPRARFELREILKELQAMGKTIVISSHILPELSELCTMVGIIDRGRMRAVGTMQQVIQRLTATGRVRVSVVGSPDKALKLLAALPSVTAAEPAGDSIEASYDGQETTAAEILQRLVRGGVKVSAFTPLDGGLEDAFLRATDEVAAG